MTGLTELAGGRRELGEGLSVREVACETRGITDKIRRQEGAREEGASGRIAGCNEEICGMEFCSLGGADVGAGLELIAVLVVVLDADSEEPDLLVCMEPDLLVDADSEEPDLLVCVEPDLLVCVRFKGLRNRES